MSLWQIDSLQVAWLKLGFAYLTLAFEIVGYVSGIRYEMLWMCVSDATVPQFQLANSSSRWTLTY